MPSFSKSAMKRSERCGLVNITFVAEDVQSAYDHAVKKRAAAIMPPITNPWGQNSSYVRDDGGQLVEIASPSGDAQA